VVATVSPSALAAGTILAFDFGTHRIGVAVGESATRLAHPLATIIAERKAERFAAIRRLVDEWRPTLILIGLPTHADGMEHELTASARRFARQIEGRFALPVALVDERFTTRAATEVLASAGVTARRQRGVRDQIAAQLILQAYLDEHGANQRTS
jgi:putative holliday junction resolvase